MSTAPRIDIDLAAFWRDPYPALARLRKEAPIAFVPQLGSTLLCSRDDIFISEKQIDVFSSHQPEGLMNKLMGHNMMRKDGEAHMKRKYLRHLAQDSEIAWVAQFQTADRIIGDLWSRQPQSISCRDFALPFSAECLKSITGLTNMRFEDMNAWSQGHDRGMRTTPAIPPWRRYAMPRPRASMPRSTTWCRCSRKARSEPAQRDAGIGYADAKRARNKKLAISGGQDTAARRCIAGTVWALLHHRPARAAAERKNSLAQAFEEYAAGSRRSACRRAGSQSHGPSATSPSNRMNACS